MMILKLLFLGFCVCQVLASKVPAKQPPAKPDRLGVTQYYTIRKNTKKVKELLDVNILTMKNESPLLNDSRRHYAEIINVIHNEGMAQSGCVLVDYSKDYQISLNDSAPEAIHNPQVVVKETQKFIDDFNEKTHLLHLIIDEFCTPDKHPQVCNEYVDKYVNKYKACFDLEVQIYKAGGNAAEQYLQMADEIATVSKEHGAHKFVVEGAAKLETLIKSLGDVIRNLNYRLQKC